MELSQHNNMKTMRRKRSQTMVKDTKPREKLKAPQRVVEKNFTGPHIGYIYLSQGSYNLQPSSYQRMVRMK